MITRPSPPHQPILPLRPLPASPGLPLPELLRAQHHPGLGVLHHLLYRVVPVPQALRLPHHQARLPLQLQRHREVATAVHQGDRLDGLQRKLKNILRFMKNLTKNFKECPGPGKCQFKLRGNLLFRNVINKLPEK